MNGSKWPMVALGEVLRERDERPSMDDLIAGRVSVIAKIGFADGRIELRSDPQTKTGMILARPGDIVVSGINAWKGAIALYDAANARPVAATIHYGAYAVVPDRADARFLWWVLRSSGFRDILERHVPGGIKTELKAARLLPVPIPLPPLAEQRRIVAWLDAIAERVEEVQRLRGEVEGP